MGSFNDPDRLLKSDLKLQRRVSAMAALMVDMTSASFGMSCFWKEAISTGSIVMNKYEQTNSLAIKESHSASPLQRGDN